MNNTIRRLIHENIWHLSFKNGHVVFDFSMLLRLQTIKRVFNLLSWRERESLPKLFFQYIYERIFNEMILLEWLEISFVNLLSPLI